TAIPVPKLNPQGQLGSDDKQVKLELRVTPFILGQSEDIQMTLKMTQDLVVGRSPAAGGAPITASNTVETILYVKSSESAAVAGVTTSDIGTSYNTDDPHAGSFDQGGGNGQAPTDPLFSLIRSKGYRKNRSQFVAFVTPQIIENASEGTEDL